MLTNKREIQNRTQLKGNNIIKSRKLSARGYWNGMPVTVYYCEKWTLFFKEKICKLNATLMITIDKYCHGSIICGTYSLIGPHNYVIRNSLQCTG